MGGELRVYLIAPHEHEPVKAILIYPLHPNPIRTYREHLCNTVMYPLVIKSSVTIWVEYQ